ncbi:mucin-16-like [Chiloscyllium punctatum]|uniref:mucin-16-like n=1 Tax=Chiloscyllium punctatum TaxID=137246 RepID=UPI003B6353E5
MIANELNDVFKSSSITATFSSCRVHSFSMVNGDSSTVTAVCSFNNDSTVQDVDRILVYHVFENKTEDVSKLGPYTLDNDSLYVNGYHEEHFSTTVIPLVTPIEELNLIDYNMTFIIRDPSFQDIESNSSNQTSMIANELNDLFKSSTINPTFASCRFQSFSIINGDSSTVTAICSFKNDSTVQNVDRELVYYVFENKTKDVSKFGPYTLDNDSLFVNDYHEARLITTATPLVTTTEELSSIDYNLTFIISSPSFQDIESNSSNQTSMITIELNDLFKHSSINATFASCRLQSFSMVDGDRSTVTAMCSFKNDSTIQDINRVLVYHVFENKSKDASALGPYILDKDSLYVNAVVPLVTPTEELILTDYNLTFIISHPSFQDIESNSSNQTGMIVNELNDLFKYSSINATFASCRLQSFSMVDGDRSTVTAMCSFKNDSTIEDIDRMLVYHVFENKTKDASTLGPYTLDKDSLYVNDYHETRLATTIVPLVTPTEELILTDYNLTFIISRPSFQDIESNSSNQTGMIANELNDMFKYSSINATFASCRLQSFSMVDGDRSTVTAMCSFKNDSTIEDIDRVLVYHVFENKTKDSSTLGPYTLDKDSLYVNDYHETRLATTIVPLVTPTEELILTDYNLTFIISRPSFQDIESNSSNQTGMIANELNDMFKYSSINATFASCRLQSFSMVDGDRSTVTAMCSFKNDSTIEDIDRVLVYHVFENKTKDSSTLGPYTLDKDSLYVNDYHETRLATTIVPLVTPTEELILTDYNLTFIISRPSFQDIESNSSNQTGMIANELNDMFKYSSINATFASCRLQSFSMVDGDRSTVTAMCSFKNDSTIEDIDRVLVYHVFENKTKDASTLGPYTLDKDSLYVNDYHEIRLATTVVPLVTPTEELILTDYNLTFIISRPSFQDIESNSSNQTGMIANELNDMFKYSSINATFASCRLQSFSMVDGDRSTVTAMCSFKNDSTIEDIDRVLVYHVFENKTKDASTLGPYTLDKDSLYVNAVVPLVTPTEELILTDYNLTFIISSPSFQDIESNSSSQTGMIANKLNDLFKYSSINTTFSSCRFQSLR